MAARVPAPVIFGSFEPLLEDLGDIPSYLDRLQWAIVGAESGPSRRHYEEDWARSIRDQCIHAKVPFFYKQGRHLYPGRHRELDGRLWEQYPEVQVNAYLLRESRTNG
jgi:protein gp37